MTEEQFEIALEKKVDALDKRLIPDGPRQGTMTQEEYDRESREIDRWAEATRRRHGLEPTR